MHKSERQDRILSDLRARPSTRLGELAEVFGVSKETIRRDLAEMSRRGLLDRTYGGAFPASLSHEPGMRERLRVNPEGRQRMAGVAAGLVHGAGVIMIDTGATMAHLCERLAAAVPRNGGAGLTAITNGMRNAVALSENPAIRVVVCPGRYDEHEMAVFGPLTLEFIGRFHADAVLTSAGGIDESGAMDANSDAAAVKRAMLKRAGRSIFVFEGRKFNFTQFETVCPLSAIDDLVTDEAVPRDLAAALAREEVRIHVAAAGPGGSRSP